MSPGLDADAYNPSDAFTFPNGCHAAEVEIDPETGAVTLERYIAIDDYGRLINPMLTSGQVQGGLAQGIGQAMLERTVYDGDSGQLLSGSLMDYALPRADDLPPLEVTLSGVPTERNPLGVKGSGQAGCIAAPQTIVHAILNALAPLGIDHIDMPATPERVWRAIRDRSKPPARDLDNAREAGSSTSDRVQIELKVVIRRGLTRGSSRRWPGQARLRRDRAMRLGRTLLRLRLRGPAQPPFAPNSASNASRTVSRSSRFASIIGAVSTMIWSISPISFRRL